METPDIIRIPILPMSMVNAFIVRCASGAILVDTGLPRSTEAVLGALARIGLGPRELRLIVITHAHVDHAGGAARLRELSGAPVAAHRADLPFLAREAPMTFCPTGWFGRAFLRSGLMHEPYQGFAPDIVLDDDGGTMDLAGFGCRGLVRATPGHTAGSLSVELEGGDVLAGDLLASGLLLGGIALRGRPKRPPFEDDPGRVADALEGLLARGGQRFHIGHGGPLPAPAVQRHVRTLRRCACCR